MVDYVCDRFGQDKVIIMGHSYGSLLGSQYVLDCPDKVSHYIGIGQEVKEENWYSYTYVYEDALAKAKEAGDDTAELEAVYEAFINDPSLVNMNGIYNAANKYHPVTVTEDVSTKAMIFSPYLGVDDVRWSLLVIKALTGDGTYERLIGPLEKYLLDFNAYKRSTDYQVPVLFISGSEDWSCPVGLIEEYFDVITAPRKDMYLLDGCGHSPQSQLPEEFGQAVKDFLSK